MYGRSLYAWRRAQLIARIPADTSPTPTIASCSPATTPGVGGGAITITGTGFMSKYGIPYIDTVIFDQTIASFSIVSPTSILAIAPVHGNGAVSVIVKGSGGGAVKPSAVTFTGGLAPTVSAIAPAIGLAAGGTAVTITVNDSTGCTSAAVGGLAITSFAIVDGTHVSGVTAAHAAGATDVTVTNMTGTSLPLVGAFTYGVVPAVSAITPSVGLTSGGTAVSITVANSAGCTGASVGGVALSSFAIADGTHVTGTTGAHAAGATDVLVTNAFGTSSPLVGAFTYGVAPTVSSITPNLADTAGGGAICTITGANLTGATAVSLGGTAVTSFSVINPTTITCTPAAHASGASLSVSVTTPYGTTGANTLFEYWTPAQITGIQAYLDANKGVTGGAAVSAWTSQSSGAIAFNQATGAAKPAQTASVFGSLPSIRFTGGTQFVQASALIVASSGYSLFWGGKTSTTFGAPAGVDAPGTVIGQTGGTNWGAVGYDAGASCGVYARIYNAAGSIAPVSTAGSGFNDGTTRMHGWTSTTVPVRVAYSGSATPAVTGGSPAGGYDAVDTAWDTIGAGVSGLDGFIGDLAFVVIVNGFISGADFTKLNTWSQQRWATP